MFKNCNRTCQRLIVETFERNGTQIPKFNGRWYFDRPLGIEEFASALFSLFNLLTNITAMLILRANIRSPKADRLWWTAFFICSCATWICSTVFHIRSNRYTEKLDYVMASLLPHNMLASFVFRVREKLGILFPIMLTFIYCTFAVYCTISVARPINYGMNTIWVASTAGLALVFWLAWSCSKLKRKYPVFAIMTHCLVAVASLLEFFDFPPIFRIFDAHSLWHYCTSFAPLLWVTFLVADCQYQTCKQTPR